MRTAWWLVGTVILACAACGVRHGDDDNLPKVCVPADVRCGSDGHRETCTVDGAWSASDFVCTVNVAVDDEVGTVCATKADGRYRCWTIAAIPTLPAADYRRVQASRKGPVGLTRDGQVFSVGVNVPAGLPPISELRSTNMWGFQSLCYRTSPEDALTIHMDVPPDSGIDPQGDRVYPGPFRQAFCAFEGLACGILMDGTVWCNYIGIPLLPGNGWKQLALGMRIFCGVRDNERVECGPGMWSHMNIITDPALDVSIVDHDFDQPIPVFPVGSYAQVAVTNSVACALSTVGELHCLGLDGGIVAKPPGRYSFLDAAYDTVCAIGRDGTTACWRHDGDASGYSYRTIAKFDPYTPAIDPDW